MTPLTNLIEFDGACDCHMHIYEPGFPLAPTATFKPPHAPVSAYREVQQALGLKRAIVVQPTGYGFDNRCTLRAIGQLGPDARGIAVVAPEVTNAALEQLHAAGVRGVRFMMLAGGVLPWSALKTLAARIAPLGWHINVQLDGHHLGRHEAVLNRLPCSLVIDHLGKFLGPLQPDSEGWLALHRLLDGGRCWIKLSAPYESSLDGPPHYADRARCVRELAESHPERALWATNWPHPNVVPKPDNATLLDWAFAQIDSTATRRRILVDNPAELYGF